MIFEVFETLVRRGGESTLEGGCSYCWPTASTVFSDSASLALSVPEAPAAAPLAASSFSCLMPASMLTRPLILSTEAARTEFSVRSALRPSRISLSTASLVVLWLDMVDMVDLSHDAQGTQRNKYRPDALPSLNRDVK